MTSRTIATLRPAGVLNGLGVAELLVDRPFGNIPDSVTLVLQSLTSAEHWAITVDARKLADALAEIVPDMVVPAKPVELPQHIGAHVAGATTSARTGGVVRVTAGPGRGGEPPWLGVVSGKRYTDAEVVEKMAKYGWTVVTP